MRISTSHQLAEVQMLIEILRLCVFMTLGSVVTWYWIPETCDERGESRSLEELGLGYQRSRWTIAERDLVL
jgi:hypothetical protein